MFGNSNSLGASIIDALDTLYLMDLKHAYKKGRDWVEKHFDINVDYEISAFEVNIRFVGGFLALYTLTNDSLYMDKAIKVADALLPVFETPTGLPVGLVNPLKKKSNVWKWVPSDCSLLTEVGTFSLEFEYLSDLTGYKKYSEKVKKIQSILNESKSNEGFYFNFINPNSRAWCTQDVSIGAYGDSFYEYLLKLWLYSGKKDELSLKMHLDAMNSVRQHLLKYTNNGLAYIGTIKNGQFYDEMSHLSCFIGGLFALTAENVPLNKTEKKIYYELAINLTETCHESYIRTPTRIGPEIFQLKNVLNKQEEIQSIQNFYSLRPEVIESYFYLWRLTKDQKYRDWAWDAAQSIEKYCKTPNGYTGIIDVYNVNSEKDDVQQTFFFAETLKYLFLIFSDDNVLPLDKYVFNTEAHPLPIRLL